MSTPRQPRRRQFLALAGATTVLSRAGGSALADEPAKPVSPNDRIRIALLGAGGQGQADTARALQVPGVELVAAADIYDGRFAECREKFGKDLRVTRDYREILGRRDVDAVIVASSDHWHHADDSRCPRGGQRRLLREAARALRERERPGARGREEDGPHPPGGQPGGELDRRAARRRPSTSP